MSYLHKLRTISLVSSSIFAKNKLNLVRFVFSRTGSSPGSSPVASNPRFYGTKMASQSRECGNYGGVSTWVSGKRGRISQALIIKEAQDALLEYLHLTRGIPFMDAENMSRNSPIFLQKLLGRVKSEGDIGWEITRFLRYHPINEFEPFFESMGLQPAEYNALLPRGLMFLSDNDLLLENYHVLCNYGVERSKIGKIYKAATQVLRYDYGVLQLKLKKYEELGVDQATLSKFVVCSPYLLVGGVNEESVKVLDILKNIRFESGWELIDGSSSSYNWKQILGLIFWFKRMGCSNEELAELITQHPDFLFEDSGSKSLSLIGLLLKMGSPMMQICSVFLQFPQIQVDIFVSNIRQCLLIFNEIEMGVQEIGYLFRSHPLILGSYTLKKTNSLLARLNVGKKRLCQLILENPKELKNWKLGTRLPPLPGTGELERSMQQKTQFLLKLGLEENSSKMERAFKVFRGKGYELQERFDCIVEAGIDEKDVYKMIEVSPQILNQKKDILEEKIDFFVNNLGYPVSSLIIFPSCLNYTSQRVTLRLSMYNWLKEQGRADLALALSTVIACSEKSFLRQFVNRHPMGMEVWQNMKREIYSDSLVSPAQ